MFKKIIILVRHGQYYPASNKEVEKLTILGTRQAKLVAKRLRENNIDKITHSSMPRAIETAQIIRKKLRFQGPFESCDLLRECVPGFPKNLRKKHGYTDDKKLDEHKKQAEKAFQKHFKIPKKNSVEVLVCHGNMIRYLICRVLDIDTLKWRHMDIQQCGISIVEVRSKNTKRVLISHNDVGHIPISDRTFI